MRRSTLYIGFRCPITSADAPMARAENAQNTSVSVMEVQHRRSRDDQVDHRRREQPLPSELHQLVVAVAGHRPPHPDVAKEDETNLDQEPDPAVLHRQEWS